MTPEQSAHYRECLAQGCSPGLAEMFALASPPACMTDAVFLQGHCNGSQFAGQPRVGDLYAREALAAGVDPKGKVYLGGLADYPGDPRAWVSGRGDARKVLEERGWGAEGAVSVRATNVAEPGPYRVADDIVEAGVRDRLGAIPVGERRRADLEAVREEVRAVRTGDAKL